MTEWRPVRLKHLAAVPIVNGVGEPAEFDEPAWPRYVRTTDIAGPRRLRQETFKSLPPSVAQRAPLLAGDLLMTAAGTIGKSYLHTGSEPACFAGYLVRFRARPGVDPRFVAYWTESTTYWQQIESLHVKATIENFSAGRYRNLVIHVPPYATQIRIADFLDREATRIDAVIHQKMKLVQLLHLRRAAHLCNAVLGRLSGFPELVPTGDSTLPELPREWHLERLRHVASEVTVGVVVTPSAFYAEEGMPFIRGFNVRPGLVTDQDMARISPEGNASHPKSVIRQGDVLVVRTGQAGAAAVVPDWAVGGNCVDVLIVRSGPRIRPKFLELVLNSEPAARQIETASVGAIQSHFNVGAIQDLVVPLPPLADQDHVIDTVAQEEAVMLSIAERGERQIRLLHEHRRALVTAAVTGQLTDQAGRVRDRVLRAARKGARSDKAALANVIAMP